MSAAAAREPAGIDDLSALQAAYDAQRTAFRRHPDPSYAERRAWLKTLHRLVVDNQQALAEAINTDFGGRSSYETRAAELFITVASIKYLRNNLADWMRVKWRHVDITFAPAKARVHYQPKGVVGVIAPWNYPVQLALVPLATALAAGNRVLLKPSELTPNTSALLAKLLHAAFPADLVAVTQGGPEVGAAFSALPLDHLLYTGSTHVGRLVMRAAAENLVPVTLELGGKSPVIIHRDYPVAAAASRVAYGKLLNAGQTCIAPDYVLVHSSQLDAFVASFKSHAANMFPRLIDNPDYTSIINRRHYDRLAGYVADALKLGATVIEVNHASEANNPDGHKMLPHLVLNGTPEMRVMQDEIFGPLLPVVTYDTLDEAINYVNDRPRPLALYYFDHDGSRSDHVLRQTHSGGACLNDVILHVAVDDLPFGGVGPSGMGAYHGFEGFETFSHKKSVFVQRRLNLVSLFNPPYGLVMDKLLSALIR